MFPLGSVFLPGDLVPLRIFEPRYVEMMHKLLAGETEVDMSFGCVLIGKGSEVGGDDQRRDVGVMVHIEQCVVTPEGGYALVGLAGDIVLVDEWLVDEPFPRARVGFRQNLEAEPEMNTSAISDLQRRIKSSAEAVDHILLEVQGPNLSSSDPRDGYLDLEMLDQTQNWVDSLADVLWYVARHLPAGPELRYDFLSCLTLSELVKAVESAITHTQELLAFSKLERD